MTDQPFLNEGLMHAADGARMPVAATHNSMVSSDWFRNHADIRFDPELGVLGGEDMVLFRTAEQLGLRIHFRRRRRCLRLRIGRSHHAAVPPAFQLLALQHRVRHEPRTRHGDPSTARLPWGPPAVDGGDSALRSGAAASAAVAVRLGADGAVRRTHPRCVRRTPCPPLSSRRSMRPKGKYVR